MLEKLFHNADLNVDLTSFIDNKQNIWFKGKYVALILGYSGTDQAIRYNVKLKISTSLHLGIIPIGE